MIEKAKFVSILDICKSVITKENHYISNMANLSAILMEHFGFHWVGFYLVDQAKENLFLGPFQGPLACTKIAYGKGVCGTAWKQNETIVVDNVHEFSGHIACSSLTNSEIVLPITIAGEVFAVLDIDSVNFSEFSPAHKEFLLEVTNHLVSCIY